VSEVEAYVLQQDGCYVDSQDIQHYLFPREIEEIESSIELAQYEFAWHLNPSCQGQYVEGEEIIQDWETLDKIVKTTEKAGVTYQLFPREIFVEYVGKDWDAIAYLEWRWYSIQAK
jgi:hypothetical protein